MRLETGMSVRVVDRLDQRLEENRNGGGPERIGRQHGQGKLTARERIDVLLDQGSFEEMGALVVHRCEDFGMGRRRVPGDGLICGHGRVDSRPVVVFAQDFTVLGGTLSEANAGKICRLMDMAMKIGVPIVGLKDSGGARIQEGVSSLAGYAEIFLRNTLASGAVPQISAIMGPSAGGAVYSPAITDFIFMVEKTSYMFVTGPEVIKTVTHEEVSKERLGGARTHASESGVAHFAAPSDIECLLSIRRLLSFLPPNNMDQPPVVPSSDPLSRETPELEAIVPEDANKPYDIKAVIRAAADDGDLMEVHEHFARNIVVGYIRIGGRTIGVIANQPGYLAGVLDINASIKGARFVRFCDAFNIPLWIVEDVPGFLPGIDQELGGIIRQGAKLLFALAEATVPKVTTITRKAYGGAYAVMGSKHIRTDINLAFPTAEIAVMGAQGAVNILYRKEIQSSGDPEATRERLIAEYQQRFANPFSAAEKGFLDEVIRPRQLRSKLASAFALLQTKREHMPTKKHANIPL
jgi:propionyl-CoA carboxylase beta chain